MTFTDVVWWAAELVLVEVSVVEQRYQAFPAMRAVRVVQVAARLGVSRQSVPSSVGMLGRILGTAASSRTERGRLTPSGDVVQP